MVETITPVVHGGRRRWMGILSLHVLGAVAGAGLVGGLAAAAGRALGAPWESGGWVVAGLAGIYLLREGGIPVPLPQVGRQVPESWRRTMPAGAASLLYGLMLGVGYVTHLGHGTWLVVGAAAATTGRPFLGAAIAAPFGLARGAVLAVTAGARGPDDASRLIDRLESFSRTGVQRMANGAVLGAVAVVAAAGVGLGRAAAVTLAVVFAWAAASKILAPARWSRTLAAHGLPGPILRLARFGVPAAELAVSVAVLAGQPRAAALLAGSLLAAFSTAIIRARTIRGNRLPCGCFGRSDTRDYRVLLGRNAALGAVAVAAFGAGPGPAPLRDAALPSGSELLPAALTLAGAGLAFLLVRRSVRMLGRS